MSRRISLTAKQERKKPNVHFPDELVFLDSIKENDLAACNDMLSKASQSIDINALNDAGLTPLHQAVLEDNVEAVRLLLEHGAEVNKVDTDTWTPLHAACAEGHAEIVRLLLWKGAKKEVKTTDGERPLDLIDASDLQTIGAMLESETARNARIEEDSAFTISDEDAAGSKKHHGSKGKGKKKRKGKKGHGSSKDEDESDSDE